MFMCASVGLCGHKLDSWLISSNEHQVTSGAESSATIETTTTTTTTITTTTTTGMAPYHWQRMTITIASSSPVAGLKRLPTLHPSHCRARAISMINRLVRAKSRHINIYIINILFGAVLVAPILHIAHHHRHHHHQHAKRLRGLVAGRPARQVAISMSNFSGHQHWRNEVISQPS